MSVLCIFGKHEARPSNVWNEGLCFSNCRRCGRDMVRADWDWKVVERNFRVVWKPAARAAPNPLMVIPACVSERVAVAGSSRANLERINRPRPRFGFGQLFAMGINFLVWYGAESLGKWQRLLAPPTAQHPVRLLARQPSPA